MAGLANKFRNLVDFFVQDGDQNEEGLYEELSDYMDDDESEQIYQENPIKHNNRRNNLKVLSHPAASGSNELMVIEPKSFEEALEVANNLRARKTLILNLHLLDAEQSQRVVDFISGATHAIDGHQQKVGEGVFVFTPSNVSISVETEKTRIIRDAFWKQA